MLSRSGFARSWTASIRLNGPRVHRSAAGGSRSRAGCQVVRRGTTGLGSRFLSDVDQVFGRIRERPQQFPVVSGDIRRGYCTRSRTPCTSVRQTNRFEFSPCSICDESPDCGGLGRRRPSLWRVEGPAPDRAQRQSGRDVDYRPKNKKIARNGRPSRAGTIGCWGSQPFGFGVCVGGGVSSRGTLSKHAP
jgi:hypothetical protein